VNRAARPSEHCIKQLSDSPTVRQRNAFCCRGVRPQRRRCALSPLLKWIRSWARYPQPHRDQRCAFPSRRCAGPICLAGSTANFTSLPCGSGPAPIGRSYFHRLFRLLGLQRPLQPIRPRDRLLCLAVSLMLTRITPGPMMARHGLSNLRLCNLPWCMALLPLSIRACKEWFFLEVEAVVKTRTRRGYGIRLAPHGHTCLLRNRRPPAKALAWPTTRP
jgi:hypothetical protein